MKLDTRLEIEDKNKDLLTSELKVNPAAITGSTLTVDLFKHIQTLAEYVLGKILQRRDSLAEGEAGSS